MKIVIYTFVFILSGCANMENIVYCDLSNTKAVVSPVVGISLTLSKDAAQTICANRKAP